ncbi:MAG: RagB/SusD family nutrient uptake outer membrane protein, partial [Cytophagales bacterium]|nr:RagB/SusD family nutrient uptake outer membrane protein [Cytophagales bacterium]
MKNTLRMLIGALSLSVFSCDFLDVAPVSSITSANFFKSATDAEAAITACYDGLQNSNYNRDVILVSGIMSDEMRASTGGNFVNHQSFNPALDQGNVRDFWRDSYAAVQRCLDVLENVPAIQDPALNKDRVMGEAYFIRGLLYFHLTRYYGRIPLIGQSTTSPTQDLQLPRAETGEVYEAVVQDLLEAERLLPASSGSKYRATQGAARAMLARVYLFRNQPDDYARALAECEEVMADNQYQLVAGANFADLFTVGKQNAAESIFEISYRPNVQQEGGAAGLDDETVPGNRFRVLPEQKLLDAFAANPGDLRKDAALGVHNSARFTNLTYIKKYQSGPPEAANRRVQDPNVIMIHLADVILMRAESLNELGRTEEAIPFLNQVRR